ncbi:hypothetical protein AJ79_08610 [Helicocarpus griseus UAMH5409]|uniref:Uncharacterized protein n=1 Tax=Helicocarpus griseus UAMH5409 TaxID=1447875 RepID=A0A2B7WRX4_9EURO|nr:hypothetical protein AJ79_08610 [Helicocarpus griseus UAMH5409]
MRATTYSILASFFSLAALDAPLCEARDAAAPARPRYYFPRDINRDYGYAAPAEKRAPQDADTTVVVVPVTVYVGPDGKPLTMGGEKKTEGVHQPQHSAAPVQRTMPLDQEPTGTPDSHRLGKINLGVPNEFVPPSSSLAESEGISYGSHVATGGSSFPSPSPEPTPSPSESSKSSKFGGFLSGLFPSLDIPTLELPSLGRPTSSSEETGSPDSPTPPVTGSPEPTGTGAYSGTGTGITSEDKSKFTMPPLFPDWKPSSTQPSNSSATGNSTGRPDFTDLVPTLTSPSLLLPSLPFPTGGISLSLPSLSFPGSNSTGSYTTPPSFPTPSYNGTIPSGIFPNPTDIPTGVFPTGIIPTSEYRTSTPSETPSPSKTSTKAPSTTEVVILPTQTVPPTTTKEPQKPLSTDSLTSMIIPTSIVYQPTPVPPNPSETKQPTALPRVISPDSGIPKTPADSALVHLGFNSSLSYEFVVSNRDSIIQIFSFTPLGVSYGLEMPADRAIMQSIQPYDTVPTNSYTTALALIYIPENMVNQLAASIHNPNSLLYRNPDPSVAKLMSMLDPSIPLVAGGIPYGQGSPGSGSGSTGSPGQKNGGSPGDDGENEGPGGSGGSSNVRATSVGIGLGVVGGAALYGAAMFFVARRYRKRRKLHRRTSSLTSGMGDIPDSPPTASDALMSGGRTEGYTSPTPYAARNSQNSGGSGSARTQMISAPVMAENSLGWN